MTYNSTVLADSPTHYLTFDQTNGSYTDSGSAGATISKQGSPTVNTTSFISGASVNLDGTSQGLSINGSVDFSAGTAWTFEAWFKTTVGTGTPEIIRKDGGGRAYLLRLNSGNIEWYCNAAGIVTSGTNYADNKWHHVVATYSLGATKIYVDGVQFATTGSGTSGSQGTVTAYVGSSGGASEWFGGSLDEVAIYTTALSAARVTAHYNAGLVSPNVTVTPPAMTASGSAPAPVVTAVDSIHQTLSATADKDSNAGGGTATTLAVGNGISGGFRTMFLFPTPTLSAGTYVSSAQLVLVGAGIGTSATSSVRLATSSWVESNTTLPSYSSTSYGSGTVSGTGTSSIDVTAAVQAWLSGTANYGIVLESTGGVSVYSRENATNKPQLVVTLAQATNITATPPASLASASMQVPAVAVTTSIMISAPAATSFVTLVSPAVGVQAGLSVNVPAASASVEMLVAKAFTPDATIHATAATAAALMPTVKQFVALDKVIQIGAMTAGAESEVITISNQTDRNVLVFNPMTATAKMTGMYNSDLDRYLKIIPGTTDSDDVWLKMEERAGSVANDSSWAYDADGTTVVGITNGRYNGSPTFDIVNGPEGRPALHFDGIDDYVRLSALGDDQAHLYKYVYTNMDATIEFSIRTSQQNGTIFSGGANGVVVGDQSGSMSGTNSVGEVRIVNGELILWSGPAENYTYKTGVKVADGNWHHVIISIPSNSNYWANVSERNFGGRPPYFIQIDGRVAWQRFETPLQARALLPTTVMAGLKAGAVYGYINGDMRDFIVRLNYAVSPMTAMSLYYEWSNTVLIQPAPMTASAESLDPQVHSNVKRMVALYGLPYYLDTQNWLGSTRDGLFNYYSVFAGFGIRNDALITIDGPGAQLVPSSSVSNLVKMSYLKPKPFMLEGYMVYPVAIMKQAGSNGGPFSADGMESGTNIDPYDGLYVDNTTGLPRFVDLDEDLREPITNFDALTVINYPANTPEDAIDGSTSADPLREPRQHSMFLTTSQWIQARDTLRDSIMSAAYRGVNLWITEPLMAQHCGFIQEFDKHETGARIEFFGPGNIDATGYTNKRAEQLDAMHLPAGRGELAKQGIGQFNYTWQANAKRKIINLEPGITDLAGWEITEMVKYTKDDRFALWADWSAYDVLDRTHGYQLGDQYIMAMHEEGAYGGASGTAIYPTNWSVGVPRNFIVSAKPSGIVGKPISKEMDTYYGAYGIEKPNPWKDNIYTIVAERGTVVRGQSLKGRAFIEFMDPQTGQKVIARDKLESITKWHGFDLGFATSTWSYDSRRRLETSYTLKLVSFSVMTASLPGFQKENWVPHNEEIQYTQVEELDMEPLPYLSMNARGLNWLAQADTLPAGDAKIFVPSMQASAAVATVTASKQRNIVVTTDAAEAYAEVRNPQNYRGNDFIEHVLPARAGAVMNGMGNTVPVPVMGASASMPDVNVIASGDKISVYMDTDRNVTLFMKED